MSNQISNQTPARGEIVVPGEAMTPGGQSYLQELSLTLQLSTQMASALKNASVLPEHIRTQKVNGKIVELAPQQVEANCLLICNQAIRWRVDPFALIGESYIVGGKLSFQGKLIAAIVNRDLSTRLTAVYSGEGDGRTAEISGVIRGEGSAKTLTIEYLKAATRDKGGKITAQWSRDPDQKLFYSGSVKWARRHLPEVLMGVLSEEEGLIDETRAAGTDKIETTTPNASLIEFFLDRIGAADHQGQLERIVLEAKGSRISEVEREIVRVAAREIYKDLPTAADFQGLDDVQLRDRPEGMTRGSTQASRAETEKPEPPTDPPGHNRPTPDPKAGTKSKLEAKQTKPAQTFDEDGKPAATEPKPIPKPSKALTGYLEEIAKATRSEEVTAITERARADKRLSEAAFQTIVNAHDEALA